MNWKLYKWQDGKEISAEGRVGILRISIIRHVFRLKKDPRIWSMVIRSGLGGECHLKSVRLEDACKEAERLVLKKVLRSILPYLKARPIFRKKLTVSADKDTRLWNLEVAYGRLFRKNKKSKRLIWIVEYDRGVPVIAYTCVVWRLVVCRGEDIGDYVSRTGPHYLHPDEDIVMTGALPEDIRSACRKSGKVMAEYVCKLIEEIKQESRFVYATPEEVGRRYRKLGGKPCGG